MNIQFERDPDSGLIIVPVILNAIYEFYLLLDTGATYTTIARNSFHLINHELNDETDTKRMETASGIVEAEVYTVDALSFLGQTRKNFRILVYDFSDISILSNYHGLLGLDFFEGTKFCIDLNENIITI